MDKVKYGAEWDFCPPFLTVKEVAAWLGVHENTVRRRIDAKEMEVIDLCPNGQRRTLRIARKELKRLTKTE